MNLDELVAGAIVTAPPSATLLELAKLMEDEAVGSIAIVDGNEEFVGIVTDRDVVRAVAEEKDGSATAQEVMTDAPDTVEIDTDVNDAVAWMNASGYRHLPVTENGSLVGMVSIKDLLWAVTGD